MHAVRNTALRWRSKYKKGVVRGKPVGLAIKDVLLIREYFHPECNLSSADDNSETRNDVLLDLTRRRNTITHISEIVD